MVMSTFWRFDTDRPTAAFRTIDPLIPVRPACVHVGSPEAVTIYTFIKE
jgi:hypothetical protein